MLEFLPDGYWQPQFTGTRISSSFIRPADDRFITRHFPAKLEQEFMENICKGELLVQAPEKGPIGFFLPRCLHVGFKLPRLPFMYASFHGPIA